MSPKPVNTDAPVESKKSRTAFLRNRTFQKRVLIAAAAVGGTVLVVQKLKNNVDLSADIDLGVETDNTEAKITTKK